MTLDELLRRSDVVTVHLPLIPSTRDMIGDAEIAAMKKGAILVNASRCGIVDEKALATALHSGHPGGAAIDVYSTEPPDPDPLLTLEGEAGRGLVLTSHIAGVTRQSSAELFGAAGENVERVFLRARFAQPRLSGRVGDWR